MALQSQSLLSVLAPLNAAHLQAPSAKQHFGLAHKVSLLLSSDPQNSTSLLAICLASATAQNTSHTHNIQSLHARLMDRLSQAAVHHSCCHSHLSYKIARPLKALHKAAGLL